MHLILKYDYLFDHFDSSLIHKILSQLTVDNLIVFFADEDFKLDKNKKSLTHISKVEYELESLDHKFLEAFNKPIKNDFLYFNDTKNKYLPTAFGIKSESIAPLSVASKKEGDLREDIPILK